MTHRTKRVFVDEVRFEGSAGETRNRNGQIPEPSTFVLRTCMGLLAHPLAHRPRAIGHRSR
jgi:hypothetical protein